MGAWLVWLQAATATLPPALPAAWHATGCAAGTPDEVTVCARRADRYRLPLPRIAEPVVPGGHIAGEAASPAATLAPLGRCGIFVGERHCGKAEAAAYGYGNGRDPATVLAKLGRRLADPDAEP